MNRRDGILTSTASDHPVAPFSRRYRGCNADLPAAQECQTCGVSSVASDHASPDLYPVILPPFAAGAWAMSDGEGMHGLAQFAAPPQALAASVWDELMKS